MRKYLFKGKYLLKDFSDFVRILNFGRAGCRFLCWLLCNQILKCENQTPASKLSQHFHKIKDNIQFIFYHCFTDGIRSQDSPSGVEHQVDGVVVPRVRDFVQLPGLDHRGPGMMVSVISRPLVDI